MDSLWDYMGYVYADMVVEGKKRKSLRAIVDTCATYLVLNPATVRELELAPSPYKVRVTLADRRVVTTPVYLAQVEAKGRKGPVLVAEFDVPTPLLGVFALESLGLKPNPLSGELEVIGPEGGYLLKC